MVPASIMHPLLIKLKNKKVEEIKVDKTREI